MSDQGGNGCIAQSTAVFERLLVIYPAAHRRDYGPLMMQLFRDQCRDVWADAKAWGLCKLWARVLLDLFRTSIIEHLANLERSRTMFNLFRPRLAPLFIASAVFVAVFLTTALITFILPEWYKSTARIRVEPTNPPSVTTTRNSSYDPYFIQTQLEVIQSGDVLAQAVHSLNLNTSWGKKFGGGQPLQAAECVDLLRRSLDIRPVRNTSIIEISFYSDSAPEAALVANGIVDAYRALCLNRQHQLVMNQIKALEEQQAELKMELNKAEDNVARLGKELNVPEPEPGHATLLTKYPAYARATRDLNEVSHRLLMFHDRVDSERLEMATPRVGPVEIVDRATPAFKPHRPNKPMNLFIGAVAGVILGLLAAGGTTGILHLRRRRKGGNGTAPASVP